MKSKKFRKVAIIYFFLFVLFLLFVFSTSLVKEHLDNEVLDSKDSNFIYSLFPSFHVKSDYNLSVYDVMFNDTDKFLECKDSFKLGYQNIGLCLDSKKKELNKRSEGLSSKIKYNIGLVPLLKDNKDYVSFYKFIDDLYALNNYQIKVNSQSELCSDICKFQYVFSGGSIFSDFKIKMRPGIKGTIFSYKDHQVETDFLVGYQSNGLSYYDKEVEFDLEKGLYLIKSDSYIDIFHKDANKLLGDDYVENIQKTCGLTKTLYNLYAEYDSYFGKQYIPFALDLSTPLPSKISDFELESKKKDENTFLLSFDVPKYYGTSKIDDSITEFKVYCADYDFSNSVNCILFDSYDVEIDKEKYELEIKNCNGTNIQAGKEYYFVVLPADASGKFDKKELVKKSAIAIDELAPGLAKEYKQEFVIDKSDVKGKIIHDKPIINEDGTPLFNFSFYMLFFSEKKNQNALLTKLVDMDLDKCNSGLIDFDNNVYCYPIEKEKQETPLTDFTSVFNSNRFSDPLNVIVYLIPIDSFGNFIKEPDTWAQKYPIR